MSEVTPEGAPAVSGSQCWDDAYLAMQLFAIDPAALGGVQVRSWSGFARDTWLADMQALLSNDAPVVSVHPQVDDGQLLGGLDLAATLASGKVRSSQGLLARAHGGVVIARMAERLNHAQLSALTSALDEGRLRLEREGLSAIVPARFGCVALDEGSPDGSGDAEGIAHALMDRLAFCVDLHPVAMADVQGFEPHRERQTKLVALARERLPSVVTPDRLLPALCQTAWNLNIRSLRAPLQALRAARAAAALEGAEQVSPEHAELAVRLVYGPRALQAPESGEQSSQQQTEEEQPEQSPQTDETDQQEQPETDQDQASVDDLTELLIQATASALPASLLGKALYNGPRGGANLNGGRFGPTRIASERGVPLPSRPGKPKGRDRLDLLATLRKSVPWQRLRNGGAALGGPPVMRAEDFCVKRYKQHAATVTLFVVDASGSAAMQRLAEAKGAVEELLAECYVRRDEVGLIAFRGRGAELMLPPTRSLVRAKRTLANLVGGGGTPLPCGLREALLQTQRIRRRGAVPLIVLLTDGRPNVNLAGEGNRAEAEEESRTLARALGHAGEAMILVDTSIRGQALAAELAQLAHAFYMPLPHVQHGALVDQVRQFSDAGGSRAMVR